VARTERLETLLAEQFARVRELADDQLRELADDAVNAGEQLDRAAAGKAFRLEREHAHHLETAEKQIAAAGRLEEQASRLGWRGRHERQRLRHDAELYRDHAARHHGDAERLELELSRLRAAGRHPDQWLEQHSERFAAGIAVVAEIEHRRSVEIDRQARLATLQPPTHILDLIDARPASGVRLAQEWSASPSGSSGIDSRTGSMSKSMVPLVPRPSGSSCCQGLLTRCSVKSSQLSSSGTGTNEDCRVTTTLE
jgi:hypothetical protein